MRTPTGAQIVEVFTDGACRGNPGPGGWGAILRYRGVEKELSGVRETIERMEAQDRVLEGQIALATVKIHLSHGEYVF